MDHFGRGHDARYLALAPFALAAFALGVLALFATAVAAVVVDITDLLGPGRSAWNARIAGAIGSVLYVFAFATLWYRARRARAGGPAEARRLGARPADDGDGALRRTVEELAVAAGVPVPEVWTIEDRAINALAVGVEPTDAVIVLTQGCLDELPEGELRAVLAHAMVKIAEGDLLLDLRMAAAIQSLIAPAVAARALRARGRRGSRWLRPFWFLAGVIVALVSIPGYVLARCVKVVVARLRSATTDTSAIVLAGDPHGMDAVLRRTAEENGASRADLRIAHAIEWDHALLAPQALVPLGNYATLRLHPPCVERCRRIGLAHGQVTQHLSYAQANLKQIAHPPEQIAERLFSLESEQVRRAANVLAAIPTPVREALRNEVGCHAVIGALLSRSRTKRHDAQRKLFVEQGPPGVVLAARELHPHLCDVDPAAWLALADLAQPAVRAMDAGQRRALIADLERLANGNADALEFFVALTWLHHARGAEAQKRLLARRTKLKGSAWRRVVALLVSLARLGNWDQQLARRAFSDAVRSMRVPPGRRLFTTVDERLLGALTTGVAEFARLRPRRQQQLVHACLLALAGNAVVPPHAVETARAVARAIGCTVPPALDPKQQDQPVEAQPGGHRVLADLWSSELASISL